MSSDGSAAKAPAPDRLALRDTYRKQMIDSIGGWSGTVITALPTVVFVIANAISGLKPAILTAVGTAVVLAGYRLMRKQSTQQAISGLFGVVIAALIAHHTGQARGYFLLGIWTSFVYAVPFAVSIAVRRPLVGLLWEFLDPTPDPTPDPTSDSTPGGGHPPWFRRRELLRAYSYATAAGLVVFLARGIVQLTLYGQNATGWLAFARVAMGYPLYIGAVGLGFLLVRRARKRLAVRSPVSSAQDIASDGGLGLGQRDEQ